MKLIELLEQGKKATRNGLDCKFIENKGVNIVNENFENIYPNYKDLTRNDWYEYEEYKTHFELEENDRKYLTDYTGCVALVGSRALDAIECAKLTENFALFPNKELAEFIQKKQLLERKLIVFSYLNGASEIDWHNDESKHYIDSSIDEVEFSINNDYVAWYQSFNDIFFKDRKTCEKAIELYENEIKEVMEMKKKLGL